MLIDWFTVGAQALNFIVLVWLLKHFLYKPVLRAIDAREKLIAAELADAAAKKTEARCERDEFQHKNEELAQQRAALLKNAMDDASTERQRLVKQARQAADALSAKRQEALRNDEKSLRRAIQRRTQHEVFAIARKALADLATTGLEERFAAVFTRRLRQVDGATKAGLAAELEAASGSALVRSAFELPAEQRAEIQKALNETFSTDVHVHFETAPDLVSGIELATNGQKVGWSIAEYLRSLEQGVDELLTERENSVEPKKLDTNAASESEATSNRDSYLGPEPAVGVAAWPDAKTPTAEVIAVPEPEHPKREAKSQ